MNITRREFLGQGAVLVSSSMWIPQFLAQTAAAAEADAAERILVLVQLAGGNDGLNTVVPYRDPLYHSYRKRIAIAEEDVLKLNDEIGLHPSLNALKDRFDQGHVAIVQGVGYPDANRSHFISTDIWHSASPEMKHGTGWIGRYNDIALANDSRQFKSIAIGAELPKAMQSARSPVPAIRNLEDFRLFPRESNRQRGDDINTFKALHAANGDHPKTAAFLQAQTVNAYVSSENLRELVGRHRSRARYPGDGFGNQLRLIGQLIASPLRVKVFHATLGGFDTHAQQPQAHSRLLSSLANGLNAFLNDLEEQGCADSVAVMTYSEFGRRVHENASLGTDHGAAAPMFVLGGGVKGGVVGPHPSLEPDALMAGDLRWQTDFRQVYATMLQNWLGCESEPILDGKYELLPLLG